MVSPPGNPGDDDDGSSSDEDDGNGKFPFKNERSADRPRKPPDPRDKQSSSFSYRN